MSLLYTGAVLLSRHYLVYHTLAQIVGGMAVGLGLCLFFQRLRNSLIQQVISKLK